MLVSCGTDLKFHNASTYDLVQIYHPADSSSQIRNVSWCMDGSWLIVVPSNNHAEIVCTKDNIKLLQTILRVNQPTAAVFQRTTKRNVAMSTANGTVLVYDIKGKNIKKRFVNTGSAVAMLDWSWKDTHLAIGCTDAQVVLYSNTTNQKSVVLSIPDSRSVSVVRYHTSFESILGTASDEGVVAVWDVTAGREKMVLKSHEAPVTDLVFSAQNDKLLISVGLDRTIQCYDMNSGVVALSVMAEHPLSSVDMAPDKISVAVASTRGMIYIYDLRKHDKPFKSISAHLGEIKKISYQPFQMDFTADSFQIAEEMPLNLTKDLFSTESSIIEPKEALKTNFAAGDSIINVLGKLTNSFIEKKSELSNLKLSDSIKKWFDSKENVELQENIQKIPNLTPKHTIKDKLCFNKNEEPIISPIFSALSTISLEELHKIIHNAVRESVSEQMLNLNDNLNSFYWDVKLAISKLYVETDSNMEKLFKYYCNCNTKNSTHSAQVQQLQLENEFLRNKIKELSRINHS